MSSDINLAPHTDGHTAVEMNDLNTDNAGVLIETSDVLVSSKDSPRGTDEEEVVNTSVGDEDEEEEEEKEEEEVEDGSSVKFLELFRYAESKEKGLYAVASFCACVVGALIPCFAIIFGTLLDKFNEPGDFLSKVEDSVLIFVYFGIASGLFSFLEIFLFMKLSETVSKRVRTMFLQSLLKQDIAYHDTISPGMISQKLSSDTQKFQNGINDKLALCVQQSFGFVAALGISFYYGWKLTLVILAGMPLLLIASAMMGYVMTSTAENEVKNYAKTGNIAYEALSNIKTLVSNQLERKFIKKYQAKLKIANDKNIANSYLQAVSFAAVMIAMLLTYALALYYGAVLIKDGEKRWFDEKITAGSVITCLYSLVTAINMIGNCAPNFSSVFTATTAAFHQYEVIERKSAIDPEQEVGLKITIESMNPTITFRDVTFAYPTRKEQNVLKKLNIQLNAGFNALVGSSGCGKSSILALIQRFYDVDSGFITIKACVKDCPAVQLHMEQIKTIQNDLNNTPEFLDLTQVECVPYLADKQVPVGCVEIEVDIRQLNVKCYRDANGIISQEAGLLDGTIADSIRYGNPTISDEEVEHYAKMANAHDFISKFQLKYDTIIGESSTLSGGQRQRIAIARMLAKKKNIMLLDEATAALDRTSEKEVQKSLDDVLVQAGGSITSIVIAHRLTTIQNADCIYVMDQGIVIESGTHAELMNNDDLYASLVKGGDAGVAADDNDEATDALDKEEASNEYEDALSRQQSFISESRNALEDYSDKETDPLLSDKPRSGIARLLAIVPLQWKRMSLGTLAGIAEGATFPVYAYLMSKATAYLYMENKSSMLNNVEEYCLYFVYLAFGSFICCFLRYMFILQAGEHLTNWVRFNVFRSLIHQEVGFHEANSPSVLSTRLAADSGHVKTMIVDKYGVVVNVTSNVLITLVFAFAQEWKFSLVMMFVVFPLLSISGYAQFKAISGFASKSKESIEKASKVAIEALNYYRTVTIFNQQEVVLKKFDNILQEGHAAGTRSALMGGAAYGFGNFLIFQSYALSFYVGGVLVDNGDISFETMISIFFAVEVSAMLMGQLFLNAADLSKATEALNSIFDILDRPSLCSVENSSGSTPELFLSHDASNANANIGLEFKDLRFHYPTRPNNAILKNLNFKCEPNKVTAIVSESGGGKSTQFGLIQRYYDPIEPGATYGYTDGYSRYHLKSYLEASAGLNLDQAGKELTIAEKEKIAATKSAFDSFWKIMRLKSPQPNASGSIFIDGHDQKDVDINHLRTRIATVGQEPVLFSGSIFDNIVGDEEHANLDDVIASAKMANVHKLVSKFTNGYDTSVGTAKNSHLSGGQKQRLALARALYKLGLGMDDEGIVSKRHNYNTLLLLDEATSALDSISQKLVQEAIDRAMACTTVLVIAHRLSTIQNAHSIVVLKDGEVAEQGNHTSLMSKKGVYYTFVGSHEDAQDHP